jgi:hypothetical protein
MFLEGEEIQLNIIKYLKHRLYWMPQLKVRFEEHHKEKPLFNAVYKTKYLTQTLEYHLAAFNAAYLGWGIPE